MLNYVFFIRSAYGNRTRVSAVRGPRPRPLDESAMSLRYEARKLGDSNPRYGYPYGSLANCWFQPLTQTSGMLNYVFFIRSAYGNRTRVSAVRGPRPRPLDESAMSLRYEARKLGDSNPRYGYPYGSLANCWFQPLTQTSKSSADSVFLKRGANIEGIFELCKLYQSFYYAIQCGFYPIRGLFH